MGNNICERCGATIDQGKRHVVVSVSYAYPYEFKEGATVEALEKIGDVRYHLSCAPAQIDISGKRFAVNRSETERSETER
ncbi:MAG: hypothetical protein J5I94_03880 [Phaeodactylibacter sp.]|nr:hypothetical protein [Phaeodactylibacter sp.]